MAHLWLSQVTFQEWGGEGCVCVWGSGGLGMEAVFFFLIYFHKTGERKDKSIRGRQENKWTVSADGVLG